MTRIEGCAIMVMSAALVVMFVMGVLHFVYGI